MNRPQGKYVRIDPNAPEAVGICDYSQIVFNRKDLVKQMEWRGNALVWTGFYVGRPFLDKPNPQLKPPIYPPDPVPVRDARLQQGTIPYTTGVEALPEPQRLSELQNLNWSSTPVVGPGNKLSVDGIPAFPEPVRLRLLRNFHWGS